MSWIERIKNSLTIKTGDGVVYTPSWLNATKQLEWHVSEFNFPGIDGTLVKKNKKLGSKYNLEIFFQGEFHLDVSGNFEKSLNDPRPIIISHPFYGSLTVQAPSFTVDNTGLNVSKWTGTIIETIVDDNPITTVNAMDSISIKKSILDETFTMAQIATPSVADATSIKEKNKESFKLTVPILKMPKEIEKYFNIFNQANSAVNNATASPLLAIRTTIAMISAPALFTINVTNRINLLKSQFDLLGATLVGITSPASKQIYQNLAGSALSSMCLASANPLSGDFSNSKKVLELITPIIDSYNQYLLNLDMLQTINGGAPDSFIPDADSLNQLSELLNLSISNLFSIALTSKMERSIITESDTNIIILTHRFYGLDQQDNNMNELIEENEIGLSELLQIKKGRKIVYYI